LFFIKDSNNIRHSILDKHSNLEKENVDSNLNKLQGSCLGKSFIKKAVVTLPVYYIDLILILLQKLSPEELKMLANCYGISEAKIGKNES